MAGIVFLSVIGTIMIVSLVFGIAGATENFYLSVLASVVMYLAFIGLYLLFRRFVKTEKHYPIKKPSVHDVVVIIVLGLVCIASFLLLQNAVIEFFVWIGYTEPEGVFDINRIHRYLISIVTVGVLPSIVEELLFRGLILHALLPFGKWKAVLISSALFSLFHLSPAQTVYQFIFGIVLALVYLRTKNMLVPMLLHFVNNFAIITVIYFGGGDTEFAFNAYTIITLIVLALVGSFVILNLVKSTRYREGEYPKPRKMQAHDTMSLVLGVVLAIAIWVSMFLVGGNGG